MTKDVNKICENHEGLILKQIELSDLFTKLFFELKNTGSKTMNIDLHTPDDPEAFWILDNENKINYKLKHGIGIPFTPEGLKIKSSETVEFQVVFEALKPCTKIVDIIEGPGVQNALATNWCFFDIKL